jgi:hypothetical protein
MGRTLSLHLPQNWKHHLHAEYLQPSFLNLCAVGNDATWAGESGCLHGAALPRQLNVRTFQAFGLLGSSNSCLGGVVVSVLATGHKGCGLKIRPRRWIFKGDKNPQHTFLSDEK